MIDKCMIVYDCLIPINNFLAFLILRIDEKRAFQFPFLNRVI